MKSIKPACAIGLAVILATTTLTARAGLDVSVGLVIGTPPPPPRHEVIVERPSPRHVWIAGFWHWEAGRHVWVPGHWELPPREHVIYAPAHWDHRDNGYVFVAGQWQDAPASTTISSTTTSTEIIVSQPPPPPPEEQSSTQPNPEAIWIPGYWTWANGAYVWQSGSWAMPPSRGSTFVAPRWEQRENGYVFRPGYWQQTTVAQPSTPPPVIITEPPPPPVHEVMIARPSRHHVWIAGHWFWRDGRYVWIGGHWELPPGRHKIWISPHWEYHGRGYVFVDGYWK